VSGAAESRTLADTVASTGASAGIGRYGGILDATDDQVRETVRTDVAGAIWVVRVAVTESRRVGVGGDIVLVSSMAGLRGGEDEAVYAATKLAQVGLAGAVDRVVRSDGIRVAAICRAGVETEFAIGAGRIAGDPALADYLRLEDVAHTIRTLLAQSRWVRTTQWQLWSMGQGS
jgi:NAD(P)-dependent dehydrogenase (short-subunit alcohol dehydrogenase family)